MSAAQNITIIDATPPDSTLNPTFAATTTSYTVNVTNSMSTIAVTATVRDAINGAKRRTSTGGADKGTFDRFEPNDHIQ